MSKQELLRDKEQKNKKALQENSLVQFAANQPDLYAPITLPFFNQYNKEDPKKTAIDAEHPREVDLIMEQEVPQQLEIIQKEQSSTLKL